MPGSNPSPAASFGLLALRVGAGVSLALAHGLPKLQQFAERSKTFSDPLHIGHDRSLMLAIFAELFCSLLVAIGFATRFASAVLVINFTVILTMVIRGRPFEKQELALLYELIFLALMLTGPGGYALDAKFGPKLKFGG